MAYELKSLARQKVLYDSANATNPLVYQLVDDGVKVTPTSATITIYQRGNSTALVSAASMTVSGTLLTYSVNTTTEDDWPIDTGYRAELAITAAAVVYARHLIFDVVRYLLDLSIGVDQLTDIDDRAAGMIHNGSDDLPGLIVAARSDLQARLESKILKDGKLIENAVLDSSSLATASCYFILGQLFEQKANFDQADRYFTRYRELSDAVLSCLRYDDDQDGDEDSTIGGIQQVRLIT